MKIGSIITNASINLLSGLSNNKDSIIPMAFKDVISDCVTVTTYKKEGGADDAREKAIEEFGTGAFWLFGIPIIKGIIDKTLYPLLNLNPNLDLRLLKDKDRFQIVKEFASTATQNINETAKNEADVLFSLKDKNKILKSFTNEQLYKGLFLIKFLTATAATGIILSKIIKYKQKTTKERIQNDINNGNIQSDSERFIIDKNVKKSNVYEIFKGSQKSEKISFKGALADLFMYNPIANTSLMDCVITTTRLKEARKGERKEVALKEGFQIAFVYLIARPLQMLFEKIGKKFDLPIGLDPVILFSKNVKKNVCLAHDVAKNNGLYELIQNIEQIEIQNKSLIKGSSKSLKETQLENDLVKKIYKIAKDDINNPLVKMLNDNGAIKIIKDKKTSKDTMSCLQYVDGDEIKNSLNNLKDLSKSKNLSNTSKIKAFKIFSIVANLAICIIATGAVEPLSAIWMRKKLNNGDNRNPAIVAQEKEMKLRAQNA